MSCHALPSRYLCVQDLGFSFQLSHSQFPSHGHLLSQPPQCSQIPELSLLNLSKKALTTFPDACWLSFIPINNSLASSIPTQYHAEYVLPGLPFVTRPYESRLILAPHAEVDALRASKADYISLENHCKRAPLCTREVLWEAEFDAMMIRAHETITSNERHHRRLQEAHARRRAIEEELREIHFD